MTEVQTWIEKLKQQLAAESYLDNLLPVNHQDYEDLIIDRLKNGANNYRGKSEDPSIKGALDDYEFNHPTRMLQGQAESFVQEYKILHHLPNRSSGFSATLTQHKQTGEITLSFRSTEFREALEGGDRDRDALSGADGDIFRHGFALGQLASMQDYYHWLTNESGIISADTRLDVTGYSLGGQLATAFTQLHADVVNKAYVFNGVGIGEFNQSTGDLQQMITDYRSLLISHAELSGDILPADVLDITADIQLVPLSESPMPDLYSSQSHLDAAAQVWDAYATKGVGTLPGQTDTLQNLPDEISEKIIQLYGHADHNDTEIVANQGINSSNMQSVFIEDQPDIALMTGDFGQTHSIILMMDSLLLSEAIQSIDANIDRHSIEAIYSAAYAEQVSTLTVNNHSLETVLDSFRRVFQGEAVSATPTSEAVGAFGELDYREVYYANLQSLKDSVSALQGQGINLSVISMASINLDEAVTLAMSEHGLGYRYALHQQNPFAVIADDAIYQHHDLNNYQLYDAQAGQGVMTESYLRDRADLLSLKNQVMFGDLHENRVADFDARVYQSESDVLLTVEGHNDVNQQKIMFASAQNSHLEGSGFDDRLYAALTDSNDVLEGGEGNDYLEGGLGFDHYRYAHGDGFDVLLDTDGMGEIDYLGNLLSGGQKVADGIYQSADKTVIYQFDEDEAGNGTLLINDDIRIAHFQNGQLGINLTTDNSFIDESLMHVSGNTENNLLETTIAGYLEGYEGNDWLSASELNDVLDGGAGNDWLWAANGDDALLGGAGNDLLMSGAGSNVMQGGQGDDMLLSDRVLIKITNGDRHDEIRAWQDLSEYIGVNVNSALFRSATDEMFFDTAIQLPESVVTGASVEAGMAYQYDPQTQALTYTDSSGNVVRSLAILFEARLVDNDASQLIAGDEGNDLITGNAGNDFISGGTGNDRLQGRAGDDVIQGMAGDDILLGNRGNDVLNGVGGKDLVYGGADDDLIWGGEGNDILLGDNDYLDEQDSGDDYLYGESGDDILLGNAGSDQLLGGTGNDRLFGDAGNDHLDGGKGEDALHGGWGNDYLSGAAGDDELQGDEGSDWLNGGSGQDKLIGGEGTDTLIGSLGNDVLIGSEGSDTFVFNRGDGADTIIETGSGNQLRFGHGISRGDVQAWFDPDNPRDLHISYGQSSSISGDQVTIKNYSTNLFSTVMFADQPLAAPAFSSLLEPYRPGLIEISATDRLIGVNDQGLSRQQVDDALTQHTRNNDNADGTGMQQKLNELRNEFIAGMDEFILNDLMQHQFTETAAGVFEQAAESESMPQVLTQTSVHRRLYVMDNANYSRTEKNLEHQYLETWQSNQTVTREYQVETPLNLEWELVNAQGQSIIDPDGSLSEQLAADINGSVDGVSLDSRQTYQTLLYQQPVTWQRELKDINQVVLLGDEQDDRVQLSNTYFNIVQTGAGNDRVTGDVDGFQDIPERQGGMARLPTGAGYRFDLPGNYLDGGAGNDFLEGSAFEDVLIGGDGDDTLLGGSGNDIYYIGFGQGHDLVYDNGWTTNGDNTQDILVMPEGVAFENLSFNVSTGLFDAPLTWNTRQVELPTLHTQLTMSWSETNSVMLVIPQSDHNADFGIDVMRFDGIDMAMGEVMDELLARENTAVDVDPQNQGNTLSADFSFAGGDGDDRLSLINFLPANDNQNSIGVLLPSGPVMTEGDEQKSAYGPDLFGYLAGGKGYDQLNGSAGKDFLIGGELHFALGEAWNEYWGTLDDEGNSFTGNQGDDVIWATGGDDTINYNRNDGHDLVTDMVHGYDFAFQQFLWPELSMDKLTSYLTGKDSLIFGEGISANDVGVRQAGDDLLFDINQGEGSVLFYNWYQAEHNQLASIAFQDGTVWGETEIQRLAAGLPLNAAPQVNEPIADVQTDNSQPFSVQWHEGLFTDPDQDILAYQLELENRQTLPDWLVFDAENLSLSSQGFDMPAGNYELLLTATDPFGESASQSFSLTIEEHFNQVTSRAGNWFQRGTDADDRIVGNEASEFIFASSGNDYIYGNQGNDWLSGGQGDDTYFYQPGDGVDVIFDLQGDNSLALNSIDAADIRLSRQQGSTRFDFAETNDSITVNHYWGDLTDAIQTVKFEDGPVWETQQLQQLVSAMAGFAPGEAVAANELFMGVQDDASINLAVNAIPA